MMPIDEAARFEMVSDTMERICAWSSSQIPTAGSILTSAWGTVKPRKM